MDKTVVETIQGASNGQSYNELRALLGEFLFKGDAVEKKVENLSGGEKARLSLCCMMLRESNLLILDEPTNHLDIPAKEMLEEALQHFDGSVVVISHDRYFISKVATTVVAIENKKLTKYGGDYKFYMEKSEAAASESMITLRLDDRVFISSSIHHSTIKIFSLDYFSQRDYSTICPTPPSSSLWTDSRAQYLTSITMPIGSSPPLVKGRTRRRVGIHHPL